MSVPESTSSSGPGLTWLLAPVLLFAALTGCIGVDDADLETSSAPGDELLARTDAEPAWPDPTQAPHPAFGWPTPTHVPDEAPERWHPPPERSLPATIDELEHVAHVEQGDGGERIGVFGQLAVVPPGRAEGQPSLQGPPDDASAPVQVLSLTAPSQPELLSTFEPGVTTVDAHLLATPDGRMVAVLATTAGLMPIWDVTDPTQPRELAVVDHGGQGHNVNVVPGTPIVYVAGVSGGGSAGNLPGQAAGTNLVYDLSEPAEPQRVAEWANGYGCHTVGFHIDRGADEHRAYCAGYEATQIWDIADPRDPSVVSTIPTPHGESGAPSLTASPAAFLSTMATVDRDAETLVVSDEGGIIVPGCEAHTDQGPESLSTPRGALWIYDVSDETDPQLEAWIAPGPHWTQNEPPPQPLFTPLDLGHCAAHYTTLVPQPDRDLLAVAFWQGGVALVDITDPAEPAIVDRWRTDAITTDVRYANGHLVTAHWDRGLDVLGFS